MATYLYRLGGWAFRRRRTVLVAWITVLGLVVASAAAFSGQTNDRFSVPGTESQQAQDLLEQKFPGAGGASARMVFAAPAGQKVTDQENRDAVEASLAQARTADGVTRSSTPIRPTRSARTGGSPTPT
ncbi:MAG: MMPL family transporter [Solirubrobacteraceae bacterium]